MAVRRLRARCTSFYPHVLMHPSLGEICRGGHAAVTYGQGEAFRLLLAVVSKVVYNL